MNENIFPNVSPLLLFIIISILDLRMTIDTGAQDEKTRKTYNHKRHIVKQRDNSYFTYEF